MTRLVVGLGCLALGLGRPALWCLWRTVARGIRDRRAPGAVLRAVVGSYAALVSLLAVLSFVLLFWAYGLGVVIAIVLTPFAVFSWLSAEVLWDEHPQAASWLAAATFGLATLGLERLATAAPDAATWLHVLAAAHVALAVAVLLRARRALGPARCRVRLAGR